MSHHHHHHTVSPVDNTVNLLLLGISESGKSTLFKQVKILHQNGYSKEELLSFKTTIQNNLVLGMAALIDAAQQLNFISPPSSTITNTTTTTEQVENNSTLLYEHITTILKRSSSADTLAFDSSKLASIQYVWKHEKIQQAYHQRHSTYQIIDNLNYFLDHLDRIGSPQYVPTIEDILHCRLRTTGVHETKFEFGGLGMRLVDVGGQRNQRKKWIHVFDNVTALIFVVSLVEYNQVLEEDSSTIRMNESMLLFEELVNCSVFYDKPVMLFLNKVDSFNELIKKVDISESCFKDYRGKKNSAPDAIKFIEEKFKSLRENKDADVFTEVTCAIDTNNIRKVLENLKTIILKESLSSK